MIPVCRSFAVIFSSAFVAAACLGQTPQPSGAEVESSELLNLSRKIDQQNLKIDLLSQQILRLQQEVEHPRPGAAATESAPRATAVSSPLPAGANTHVVAKGETLTSIAKAYKVSVEELQKFNHVENDRKLQIGQTLAIPGATGAASSPSPSPAAPNE